MISYYKNYLIHFEIETQLKLFFSFPPAERWHTTFFIFPHLEFVRTRFTFKNGPLNFGTSRTFPHNFACFSIPALCNSPLREKIFTIQTLSLQFLC